MTWAASSVCPMLGMQMAPESQEVMGTQHYGQQTGEDCLVLDV
jgi:hypothetical protein